MKQNIKKKITETQLFEISELKLLSKLTRWAVES